MFFPVVIMITRNLVKIRGIKKCISNMVVKIRKNLMEMLKY